MIVAQEWQARGWTFGLLSGIGASETVAMNSLPAIQTVLDLARASVARGDSAVHGAPVTAIARARCFATLESVGIAAVMAWVLRAWFVLDAHPAATFLARLIDREAWHSTALGGTMCAHASSGTGRDRAGVVLFSGGASFDVGALDSELVRRLIMARGRDGGTVLKMQAFAQHLLRSAESSGNSATLTQQLRSEFGPGKEYVLEL